VRLPAVYVVSNWSECSVQCGHGGVQSRSVVCTLLGDGWTLDVLQSYCDTRRPISERDCGYVDTCPRWTTTEWRPVSRRSVYCVYSFRFVSLILISICHICDIIVHILKHEISVERRVDCACTIVKLLAPFISHSLFTPETRNCISSGSLFLLIDF